MDPEVQETTAENGTSESMSGAEAAKGTRRRVIAAGSEKKTKKRKLSSLQEAAKAEPKLRAFNARIERMSKVIKERDQLVKSLSSEARKLLHLGE